MMITVAVVEDNLGTRENLVALLNGEESLRCSSAYASGEEALRGIPLSPPDVAIMDINLPGMSGIECVARLKVVMPRLQVLMLTTYADRDLIFDSLRAGASGYILKDMPLAELVQAVQQLHAGGAPMSMQIARKLVDHFHRLPGPVLPEEKLTQREQELLALLAKGRSDKEIADKLSISLSTVRSHLKHIYEKLQVQSRTAAVVKFLRPDQ
jgi:DNA-binding NarL/FixJ family response regulator